MADTANPDRRQAMTRLFGSCATPTSPQPAMPATDQHPAPCAEAARAAAHPAVLATGGLDAVRGEVLQILAAALRRRVEDLIDGLAGQASDLDLELDSMIGVFVCSVIADILGPQGMGTLRGNCEPGDFTSIDSVARLVCRLRSVVVAS
jgi:hypothetical protein